MSVITTSKTEGEVLGYLMKRSDRPVAAVGCEKCAKASKTGGADETRKMKSFLRSQGRTLLEPQGPIDAVEERLCDPKAVPERLKPLPSVGLPSWCSLRAWRTRPRSGTSRSSRATSSQRFYTSTL